MKSVNYPTPHINASPEDFANTVLMPGDPLRAKYIAGEFLDGARLVNNVRGIQGYTGSYKGVPVSVMASGMGMPSIGIYSYELFNFFGVENIVRIGSAGALQESVNVRDIVFGMGACTNSSYAAQFGLDGTFASICDFSLLTAAVKTAERFGVRYHVGNLLSSDTFYGDDGDANTRWKRMGVLAVEMEAAALYMNAARAGGGKRALAMCTVSDHIITGEATSSEEREKTFNDMILVALNLAAEL